VSLCAHVRLVNPTTAVAAASPKPPNRAMRASFI
jgi:hypothetical protein